MGLCWAYINCKFKGLINMSDKRLAFFLPNIFTALNMGCGFVAIMVALKGNFYLACMLIFLGSIFDSVDGRVARLTGTQSAFGEQFDSMSDLISFGIAPAIIFYERFLLDAGRIGMVVAFFYCLCGALRLARFNANIDKVKSDFFQGLPIPGAAIAVVSFILVSIEFPNYFDNRYFTIGYLLFYSVLMISNISFASFKNSEWVRTHKKAVFFIILMVMCSLFIYEALMIPVIITLYVVISLVYVLLNRKKFSGIFDWKDDQLHGEN